MDRRKALRILGSSAALAGLPTRPLHARPPGPDGGSTAPPGGTGWFTEDQRATLTALADRVIPATDTPGAVEAGTVDFIERIVSEWMTDRERIAFMRGLAGLEERAAEAHGARFHAIAPAGQTTLLRALEAEGRAAREDDPDADSFFHEVRALVLEGYYTSEVGMREELLFRPLPRRFDGCVDVAEVTRPAPGDG